MGPSDSHVTEGQCRIATDTPRDWKDLVIAQEKLDGSNCCVTKLDGQILALGRSGYLADTSPYEMHKRFAVWVKQNESRFASLLKDGERVCGEWLIQAHGTKYRLPHEPFVVFDLFKDHMTRCCYHEFLTRVLPHRFVTPRVLHIGQPLSVKRALKMIETSGHGALEPVEGIVWRVEREGKVDFLCKYVRPEKVDGSYLGGDPVWNEYPV